MARRVLLVGLFVTVAPGTLTQVACGLMVATMYLTLQLQARPYHRLSHNYLAMSTSFSLVVLFVGVILLRMAEITEVHEVKALLPSYLRSVFSVPPIAITAGLFASVVGSVLLAGLILAQQLAAERRAAWTQRLHYRSDHSAVVLPPIPRDEFHLFLSHPWVSGQDQMRVVKQRLLEMLPDAKIFLGMHGALEPPSTISALTP
jgi:hypothetical protein